MSQPNWPFEYSIRGVIQREDFDDEYDDTVHECLGTSPDDVFLLEGTQIRYGSKRAWNNF
jgi:hypothetical protein